MTNDELSELEIKLINASKKFAGEQSRKGEEGYHTYFVSTREEPNRKKNWISIEGCYKEFLEYFPIVCLNYEENANTGDINIGRLKNEERIIKLKFAYRDLLIKEIPEVKDRLKITPD